MCMLYMCEAQYITYTKPHTPSANPFKTVQIIIRDCSRHHLDTYEIQLTTTHRHNDANPFPCTSMHIIHLVIMLTCIIPHSQNF